MRLALFEGPWPHDEWLIRWPCVLVAMLGCAIIGSGPGISCFCYIGAAVNEAYPINAILVTSVVGLRALWALYHGAPPRVWIGCCGCLLAVPVMHAAAIFVIH